MPRKTGAHVDLRYLSRVRRNLTIRLDEATIRKARVLAARRSSSVSRVVSDEIARLVREDDLYASAQATAQRQLAEGFHLGGGPLPDRASLL